MNTLHRIDLPELTPELAPFAIPATSDPERLWAWLENALAAADVDGLFYLAYPVGEVSIPLPELIARALWKTTYPAAYLGALAGSPLDDDYAARVLLETGRPSRWHDPAAADRMTPGERRRHAIDQRHGMAVGACFPVFTPAGHICGGFGLRSASQDVATFDAALDRFGAPIAALLDAFDKRFRGPFARHSYRLSAQELRVLTCVAGGLAADRTAFVLGLKPKTVESYLRSVRDKTASANTTEAVAKAVFFALV